MTTSRVGNWKRVRAMLLGVFLGGMWGFYVPAKSWYSPEGAFFEEVGQIYLRLLTVGVLPIILAAIGGGVGGLLFKNSSMLKQSAKRLVVSLTVSSGLLCSFGILGWLSIELAGERYGIHRQSLGALAQKDVPVEEVSFAITAESGTVKGERLARDYVPKNPVEALANSYEIQLVIFALLLGVTIGLLPATQRETAAAALRSLEIVFTVFMALIKGLLRGLPVALFFWIANLVAVRKDDIAGILQSMGVFLVTFYVLGSAIVLLCCLFIWSLSARSHNGGMLSTLDPALTAFFTMNSLAAMPVAISKLQEMGFEKRATDQYMALFLPLLRFGNALYFALAVCFFAVVYGQQFTLYDAGLVAIYSIIGSFATIGTTSILAIYPVALIFEKFGIPSGASITLLLAVDALVDPMRTTLIVQCNAALTAFMSRNEATKVKKSHG